ncbi:ABC transporter permease [Paenibacillus senegalimassiliensis]|uniref:ABC transporter permease n=1 Tax=Paenibacillus senegalimassiliensis TaxID=1737426 RepID=UPI0018DF56D9|nr:ABC transporter permease [Paenibacillus senegalimassiliensis]
MLICELSKIKRQKFIQLSLLGAFLFPIPLTILMAKDRMSFDQLFRGNVIFGELLLLPCILGVIISILFFMERDHDTLKNLVTIPVSKTKMILAKLMLMTLLSVLYSVAALGATVVGGLIIGGVEGILYRLGISIVLGVLISIAVFPVVIVIVHFNKSYIFSIIVSFIYAVAGLIITMIFSANPASVNPVASVMPVPVIMKWYLSLFPREEALTYIDPYLITTPACFGLLAVYALVSVSLTVVIYRRKEV